jgi:hypothetical protein
MFVALCAAMLSDHQARSSLRHPELVNKSQHSDPFLVRGHHFPLATILNMSLSSSFSASRRFNLAFSFYNVLSRATSTGRIAPYWLRHR